MTVRIGNRASTFSDPFAPVAYDSNGLDREGRTREGLDVTGRYIDGRRRVELMTDEERAAWVPALAEYKAADQAKRLHDVKIHRAREWRRTTDEYRDAAYEEAGVLADRLGAAREVFEPIELAVRERLEAQWEAERARQRTLAA